MILNHVETSYSKHQKLALMDKSQVFSLVDNVCQNLKFGCYHNSMVPSKCEASSISLESISPLGLTAVIK